LPRRSETTEQIERRLAAGDWLMAGSVAKLLRVDPATVHRWMATGKLAYRERGGAGGQREADPAAVRARLADSRKVHGVE
jgi:predicted site-specific integrase-resolvase